MKKLLRFAPVFILILLPFLFFWKLIFKGYVPFPGDLLVGAYYPWLDYKWGNVVGVAIKNTLISDIFSQFYLWKKEILTSYMSLQWPLWNPYSYSGYPLLANFNSGALNPFNLLFVIFGMVKGWSATVMCQFLLTALSMFVFLKTSGKKPFSALIGAVVYSYGGFSILWSQFVNVDFAMAWIPLILTVINLAKVNKKRWLLLLMTPLFFLIVTSGHLQALVYTAILTIFYYLYRFGFKNRSFNISFVLSSVLAIGLSAIQLLPSVELMNLSIRFGDSFAQAINFGLLPSRNIVTMIAPDYFGNPSTGNFWGFFDYHETMTYSGVIGFVALSYGISKFKELKGSKFFLILALTALLMQFDTPIGRAIYTLKFPFLWTSVAGRINMIFLLAVSVLTSDFVESIGSMKTKEKMKVFLPGILVVAVSGIIAGLSFMLFNHGVEKIYLTANIKNLIVSLRNLVFPTIIISSLLLTVILSKRIKFWKLIVFVIVLIDLFRFGWKYLPIVPSEYVYPDTEITRYLSSDKSVFRIDKEFGEIMPQNTWGAYSLMSPSGYDPMAITNYVMSYNQDLNGDINPGVSRFSQLSKYDAASLGKYNVKYLLVIKRDKEARIPGDIISYKINLKDWDRVFETKSMSVLQNKRYQERARILDSQGNTTNDKVTIVSYEANKVVIKFTNQSGEKLLLADTYYPGWKATINGHVTKIGDEIRPFRTIDIRGVKEGEVVFEYAPDSFRIGLYISIISFVSWLILLILTRKNEK